MRLHCLVLVVLAGLILSFDDISASGVSQRKLRMKAPDIVGPADNDNRILRSHETNNVKGTDTDVESEERAGQSMLNQFFGRNDLTMATFSKMMNDDVYKVKMFKNWNEHKQSYGKIKERMFLELNPRFKKLLSEYSSKYMLTRATQVENVKKSKAHVRPAEKVKMTTTRVRDPNKPVKSVGWAGADQRGGTLIQGPKVPANS
ncbi:Avirulence (Avh) protein [Phytophthora megakarya]|uniref:RxLR effector protein n=1 Tax=Phytophthora megakarya TaxID=4795 RepID=A0A225UGR7_9STRA|nr:Avirulence (Avh) protein [Phytophthora megakarya]